MEHPARRTGEGDLGRAISTIASHPLALVIHAEGSEVRVAHAPVFLSENLQDLFCHFSKSNPIASAIDGQRIAVVVQGESGLIRPEWFSGSGALPTWNYSAVIIRGAAARIRLGEGLRSLMECTFRRLEIPPMEMSEEKLAHIVGFRISIDKLQLKNKLGQSLGAADVRQIAERLFEEGNPGLAKAMEGMWTRHE